MSLALLGRSAFASEPTDVRSLFLTKLGLPATASYYEVLGVAEDATPQQISAAYQRRMTALGFLGRETEESDVLTEAFAHLSDPDRRSHYDSILRLVSPSAMNARERYEKHHGLQTLGEEVAELADGKSSITRPLLDEIQASIRHRAFAGWLEGEHSGLSHDSYEAVEFVYDMIVESLKGKYSPLVKEAIGMAGLLHLREQGAYYRAAELDESWRISLSRPSLDPQKRIVLTALVEFQAKLLAPSKKCARTFD